MFFKIYFFLLNCLIFELIENNRRLKDFKKSFYIFEFLSKLLQNSMKILQPCGFLNFTTYPRLYLHVT